MARHYMQDITPPSDDQEEPRVRHFDEEAPEERSIRTLRPSAARARLARLQEGEGGGHPPSHMPARHSASKRRTVGILIAVVVTVFVLAGAGVLVLFPSTSVTIIPRTQVVTFDASMPFTAHPKTSTTTGIITYAVMSGAFEDSTLVQARGVEQAQEQAKGTITVYNNYSDSPVSLIKNTRFQTPDGLIFRIPVSIDVPGKSGNTPGSLEVEVFADQAGPEYNVGPFEKLTIPGLRSIEEMYEQVYARSTSAFSGGFSGERPAVTDEVLQAAQAEVRSRLQEKADEFARTVPERTVAFPGLYAIRYEMLPPAQEAEGVRLSERATVVMPVFQDQSLAEVIAQSVSASAEGQSVSIQFAGIRGASVGPLNTADLGEQPFDFTLSGRGQLVWRIDEPALTEALAGKEERAFETIIATFPGIQEARARLSPFWRSVFPAADEIRVVVEEPAEI